MQRNTFFFYQFSFISVPCPVPGSPGKSREVLGQEVLGPGTRQDLETLKVPWSLSQFLSPGTKQVQQSRDLKIGKVPGLKNWESPGTMETLLHAAKNSNSLSLRLRSMILRQSVFQTTALSLPMANLQLAQ